MNQYERGRAFEYTARNDLTANGYEVIRSAGSKTKVDLVAFKPGQILFVQCKRSGKIPPGERAELLRLAAMVEAVPLVAWKQPRKSAVLYWRLVSAQPNAGRWWWPDFADHPSIAQAMANDPTGGRIVSVFGAGPLPDPPLSGVEQEAIKLIRDRVEEPLVPTGQTESWCIWCYSHKTASPFRPGPVCAGSVGDKPI